MLTGGLRQAPQVRLLADGLAILHDRLGFLGGNAGVVLLPVLQADPQVLLTTPADNVLPRFLSGAL